MMLCIDTESAITDSIDQALREVFEMMLGEKLTILESCVPVKPTAIESIVDQGLTVIMGWSGDLLGSLSISLNDSGARLCTSRLIDHDSGAVDQTVIDAVGELGNMVIGGTKRRLSDFHVTMSLPTVMRAGSGSMVYPSSTAALRIKYEFSGNPMTILIALSKQAADA